MRDLCDSNCLNITLKACYNTSGGGFIMISWTQQIWYERNGHHIIITVAQQKIKNAVNIYVKSDKYLC